MNSSNDTFMSDDGTPLSVYSWEPDGFRKGVVHIAHGLGDRALRYERVALDLAARGYVVCSNDHRGHGKTAARPEDLGFFAETDGWNRAVRDLQLLMAAEKKSHPDLPLILLGHSMGSFMAQQCLFECGDLLDGCALSGSSGKPQALVYLLKAMAEFERLIRGKRHRSSLLHSLSLRRANRAFQPVRTAFDWLSRDPEVGTQFVADPLCGFVGTTQLWLDLIHGLFWISKPENQSRIPKDIPIYIFAGLSDPISDGCKGLIQLLSAYQAQGLTNVRHKFYPGGRHEMLNETNRDEVIEDLVAWLDAVTAKEIR